MKMIKMFTRIEIEDAINQNSKENDEFDLFDAIEYCGGNDVAIHYFVQDPETDYFYNDKEIELNKYLISQGCEIDEKIWIDITW